MKTKTREHYYLIYSGEGEWGHLQLIFNVKLVWGSENLKNKFQEKMAGHMTHFCKLSLYCRRYVLHPFSTSKDVLNPVLANVIMV